MRNILIIAKHNVKRFFNNKFSVMLLIAPIFVTVLLMMMLSNTQFSAAAQVGIVMEGDIPGAQVFLSEFEENINLSYLSEDTALRKLEQKKLNGVIKVKTAHLLQDLQNGKKTIELITIEEEAAQSFLEAELTKAMERTRVFALVAEGDEVRFKNLYADYKSKMPEIQIDQSGFEQIKATMIFGMFVMVFLFTCIKSLQPMMYEKENRVYERICISPIESYHYILGHILGAFVILFIQIVIQGAVMNMLQLTFGLVFTKFIGINIVLAIVGIAISLMILACAKNTQGYFIIGSFIISPLCMLSDCIFPKEFLPDAVNKVMLLSPVRWVMILYKNVLLGGGFIEVLMSLSIAIGISIVLLLMGMFVEHSKRMNRA